MPKWISLSGTEVRLVADPNKLTAVGQQGALKLDYRNYSFVPVTFAVSNLSTSDASVAAPRPAPAALPPPISVPRRPNKRWMNPPATGTASIGVWSSVSRGYATLNVDVDAKDITGLRLSGGTPTDDVQVT